MSDDHTDTYSYIVPASTTATDDGMRRLHASRSRGLTTLFFTVSASAARTATPASRRGAAVVAS